MVFPSSSVFSADFFFQKREWIDFTIITDLFVKRGTSVSVNKGTYTAVWARNGNSTDLRTWDIYYDTWNGTIQESWNIPKPITSDFQLDLNPVVVCLSDGSTITVWSRDTTPPSAEYDFYSSLRNWEIVYSKFNNENWTEPKGITNDTSLDGMGSVSSFNDTIMVAWTKNIDSNMTTLNDLEIHSSLWNGSFWSPQYRITNNDNLDMNPSIAYDESGKAIIVWLYDNDSNLQTTDDQRIFYTIYNNLSYSTPQPIPSSETSSEKRNPTVAYIEGKFIVAWDEATDLGEDVAISIMTNETWSIINKISYATGLNIQPKLVTAPENEVLLIWYYVVGMVNDLVYSINNGEEWTTPSKVTNDTSSKLDVSVCYDASTMRYLALWIKRSTEDPYSLSYALLNRLCRLTLQTQSPETTLTINETEFTTDERGGFYVYVPYIATVIITVPPIVNMSEGSRIVFTGWDDGLLQDTRSLSMVKDSNFTATYMKQYFLQVNSDHGLTSGQGWYDEGEIANFSINPLEAWILVDYVFTGWSDESITSSPEASIVMNGPKSITAVWRADYTKTYALTILVVAAILFTLLIRKRVPSRTKEKIE